MNKLCNIIFWVVAVFLTLLGIYTRLNLYISDIPLWWDEITLAESLTRQAPFDVFLHLFGTQKAPALFVFFTNIITMIFGVNTFSLRLIPLLSGIGTYFIGYFVAKKLFQTKLPIILFFAFLTFSTILTYYSNEFKPYQSDVIVLLLLILLYSKIDFNNLSIKKAVLYGFLSLLLCQFSFPAMFNIPAIIITKMIENKKIYYKAFFPLLGVIGAGLYSRWLFRNIYDFEINNEPAWTNGLLNFSFESFNNMLSDYFQFFSIDYRYGALFLIGGLIIFLVQKNKYAICMLICFIIICIASLLHIYPLTGRIILYMVPVFIFFLLKPLDVEIKDRNINEKVMVFIRTILLATILYFSFHPVTNIFDKESFALNSGFEYRIKEKQVYLKFLNEYDKKGKLFFNDKSSTYLFYYILTNRNHANK